MDLFRNGTDKTGTGQVPFTRQILSEPFVFLSEPSQFFLSCKRAFKILFFITSRMVVSNICTLITRRNKYLISRSNTEISPLLKSMILYAILSFYFTFLSQFIHLVLDIQASDFNMPLWTEKMQYVMR